MKRILARTSHHLKKSIRKKRMLILKNGRKIASIRCRRRIRIY